MGLQKRKPDFVTVTRGPGNRSNLSCGLDLAKGLSVAWQVPLLAVHHMQAHALTSRLAWAMKPDSMTVEQRPPEPQFPFLNLLVSGGHTMLLYSTALTEHSVLVSTRDIAIGQALDKIGRLVLPADRLANITDTAYAKHLTQYAFKDVSEYVEYKLPEKRSGEISKQHNKFGWNIQTPFANTKELAFSFSSIASRIEALLEERQAVAEGGISDEERLLFARTALGTAFEHLASRTILAIEKTVQDIQALPELPIREQNLRTLVVSGGVAANHFLRHVLREMLNSRGLGSIEIVTPPAHLCTDNAAMVGWCGIEMYEAGWRSSLSVGPLRNWSMDSEEPNGILAVPGWTKIRQRLSVDRWLEQGILPRKIAKKENQINSEKRKKVDPKVDRRWHGIPEKAMTEVPKARNPAETDSPQGYVGPEIDPGPVDSNVAREIFPRNEFPNVSGIVRKAGRIF